MYTLACMYWEPRIVTILSTLGCFCDSTDRLQREGFLAIAVYLSDGMPWNPIIKPALTYVLQIYLYVLKIRDRNENNRMVTGHWWYILSYRV